jgi:DNA-directed RNA polymerase subunit N (RpoN/RPB10)
MMGSELSVSSVYGEGSAFSFRVKQGVINHEPMGDYEKRAAADTESAKTGQYLRIFRWCCSFFAVLGAKRVQNLQKIHKVVGKTGVDRVKCRCS